VSPSPALLPPAPPLAPPASAGFAVAACFGVACFSAGCIGHERFAGADGEPLYSEPPSIESISWGCSASEASWSVEVSTLEWTANGDLWMAKATDYVEQHDLRSVSAAHDGSWDQLELELDIVSDWRDASPGSSTAFLCDDATVAEISFRLVVYTPGSEESSDCRSWGALPTLFDTIEGVPACELIWDEPDTGVTR
jgi:hypothetical protein